MATASVAHGDFGRRGGTCSVQANETCHSAATHQVPCETRIRRSEVLSVESESFAPTKGVELGLDLGPCGTWRYGASIEHEEW